MEAEIYPMKRRGVDKRNEVAVSEKMKAIENGYLYL
jgi:hypothetical protein